MIIRVRRKELGMTQKQLAEASEITREQLSHIEQERSSPRVSTLLNLLDALELKIEVKEMDFCEAMCDDYTDCLMEEWCKEQKKVKENGYAGDTEHSD